MIGKLIPILTAYLQQRKGDSMKQTPFFKKSASLLLAFALTLTLTSTALAGSEAYGSDVWLQDTVLQDGVVLSDNIFWSNYYSQFRHEYYITYTPDGRLPAVPEIPDSGGDSGEEITGGTDGTPDNSGGEGYEPDTDIPGWLQRPRSGSMAASAVSYSAANGVLPVAAYGSSVCDRVTASATAQYFEGMGYRVLGVINGDFYDTATGFPLGLLVSGGELLSSAGGYYAVGFRADGSVVMGQPKLAITAQAGEQTLRLSGLNKPRVEKSGATMLTYYFRNDHKTGTSTSGVDVVAAVVEGKAAIGGQLTLQVEEVAEGTGSRTLRPDQVVLTAPSNGYDVDLAFLRSLTPGQTVTISFTESSDPGWNEVTEAIGALYLLVKDGVAQTGFEVSAAPRTAVGVKANGDLVLYTIDGRQTGHSMGASLGVLAQRMAELGCVTALCLDGGGSTTMVSALPDSGASKLINSPSDKSQRKVSNHIVLLAPGGATGTPQAVNLSAAAPVVLPGHGVKLKANLADSHYYPMAGEIQFSSSAGTVSGDVLTAPLETGPVTVTASYGGISAQTEIMVVGEPDEAAITKNGTGISYLNLTPGESVQLGISASCRHLPIEAWASDFTWQITPEVGTVDENGVLTAALTSASGYVTAHMGDCSVTIPVAVKAESPFVDTAGHWASGHLTNLYYQGILTGEVADGKLYARPDRGVTRAEFSVLLCRYLGLEPSEYAGVNTPFADMNQVDTWAQDSVRAMYALGIVNGSTVDGQLVFEPRGTLTRSQAVAMLGRMLALNGESGEPELPKIPDGGSQFIDLEPLPDGSEEPSADAEPTVELGDLSQFSDADEVLPYAMEHFQKLVAMGVIGGDNGRLLPNGTMTRAAICKVLDTLP